MSRLTSDEQRRASKSVARGTWVPGAGTGANLPAGHITPTTVARAGRIAAGTPAKTIRKQDRKLRVRGALKRVRKAYASGPSLEGLSGPQRTMAKAAIPASRETGIPASVLVALSGQESNYGQNEGPSSAGARGATQFIPSTREGFIKEYGVDPWKGPKSAMKATGIYLNELDFKRDPQGALSGYSGGYSAGAYNNPILQNAKNFKQLDRPGKKPDPKDKKVLRRAGVSAKPPAKKQSGPKQLPGPFDGSRKFVRQLVGSPVRGDKEGGHSSTGDHDPSQPSAYAQDINQPGGNPAEGEPAFNQASVTRIAKNIRAAGGDIAKDFRLGQNWEGTIGGYKVQLLTATHGSGPHIHLGSRWTGAASSGGATSGSSSSSGGSGAGYGVGVGADGTVAPSGKAIPKGPTKKEKLKRVRAAYEEPAESSTDLSALERRYGAPTI